MLTAETAMRWLNAGYIEHYVCEHCHGIHFSELQALDGVLESRLFVEHEGAIMTTEIEIRPSALLTVMADLTRLNMHYPSLKIFVDLVDDNVPRLIVADYLHTQAGIHQEQFLWIVQHALMATQQLLSDVTELGFLMLDDAPEKTAVAVH